MPFDKHRLLSNLNAFHSLYIRNDCFKYTSENIDWNKINRDIVRAKLETDEYLSRFPRYDIRDDIKTMRMFKHHLSIVLNNYYNDYMTIYDDISWLMDKHKQSIDLDRILKVSETLSHDEFNTLIEWLQCCYIENIWINQISLRVFVDTYINDDPSNTFEQRRRKLLIMLLFGYHHNGIIICTMIEYARGISHYWSCTNDDYNGWEGFCILYEQQRPKFEYEYERFMYFDNITIYAYKLLYRFCWMYNDGYHSTPSRVKYYRTSNKFEIDDKILGIRDTFSKQWLKHHYEWKYIIFYDPEKHYYTRKELYGKKDDKEKYLNTYKRDLMKYHKLRRETRYPYQSEY